MPVPELQRGMRSSRQARVGRALLVAVFSTLIALGSHVLTGGSVPGPLGIVIPLTLSVLVCLPLSGRVLSLPRLILSVLVSQFLFHWLFVLGATEPGVLAVQDSPVVATGHHTQTITMLYAGADVGSHLGHSAEWMWVAHGVAAIVTILLIRRGEAALVGLVQLAALLVHTLFPRLPRAETFPVVTSRLTCGFANEGSRSRWVLAASISRRGPPASFALALS